MSSPVSDEYLKSAYPCGKCGTPVEFKVGLCDAAGNPVEGQPLCPNCFGMMLIMFKMRGTRCRGCLEFGQLLYDLIQDSDWTAADNARDLWVRRADMDMGDHIEGCNAIEIFLGRKPATPPRYR